MYITQVLQPQMPNRENPKGSNCRDCEEMIDT